MLRWYVNLKPPAGTLIIVVYTPTHTRLSLRNTARRNTQVAQAFLGLLFWVASATAGAQEIGSVDTKFNLLSPDDSIKVASFKDPAVEGITCYLSSAQKGGYKGALGLAEDTSDASIDCRQTGEIVFKDKFKKGEAVFRERRSLVFKALKVVRFCDEQENALVYLAYSEKVIEGSPKNSVSAVPLRPWTDPSGTAPACRYK